MFSLSHVGEHSLNACRPSPWGSLSALTLVQRHRDEHVLCDRYGKCVVGGEGGEQCVWGGEPGKASWGRDPGADTALGPTCLSSGPVPTKRKALGSLASSPVNGDGDTAEVGGIMCGKARPGLNRCLFAKCSSSVHRPGSSGGLQRGCGPDLGDSRGRRASCAPLPVAPRPQQQADLVSVARQTGRLRTVGGDPGSLRAPPRSLGTPPSGEDTLALSQGRAGERGRRTEAVSPRPVHPSRLLTWPLSSRPRQGWGDFKTI